jgi:hypothetical protein
VGRLYVPRPILSIAEQLREAGSMGRKQPPVGVLRLARLMRGLRPDRNPLRRASDRVEAAVLSWPPAATG